MRVGIDENLMEDEEAVALSGKLDGRDVVGAVGVVGGGTGAEVEVGAPVGVGVGCDADAG